MCQPHAKNEQTRPSHKPQRLGAKVEPTANQHADRNGDWEKEEADRRGGDKTEGQKRSWKDPRAKCSPTSPHLTNDA
jgi:hypothetical protein